MAKRCPFVAWQVQKGIPKNRTRRNICDKDSRSQLFCIYIDICKSSHDRVLCLPAIWLDKTLWRFEEKQTVGDRINLILFTRLRASTSCVCLNRRNAEGDVSGFPAPAWLALQ